MVGNISYNQSNSTAGGAAPDPTLKLVHDTLLSLLLALIMLAMGCTIEVKDIVKALRRPTGILIGLGSQFLLMPLLAFGLAHALQLSSYHALGMLVVGTCPGGTVSNIFTYWVKGDVTLSVAMTTVSTIVALGMMPLNLFIYSRSWTDQTAVVPYIKIAIALVSILVPVALGILVKRKLPKVAKYVTMVGSVSGLLFIGAAITMQTFLFPQMFHSPWNAYVAAFVLPVLGFAVGYLISTIFCFKHDRRRTIAFETGLQNVALAIALISVTFSGKVVGRMILVPLLFGISMMLESFVCIIPFIVWFRCHREEKPSDGDPSDEMACEEQIALQ